MNFKISDTILLLDRTPDILEKMLLNLPESWIQNNEGIDTWSPYDVIGHLIHGEKTDWIPRMEIILSNKADKRFTPFDRFAMMSEEKRTLTALLNEFKELRKKNIEILSAKKLTEDTLEKTGVHPEFGEITLKQLLATWVAHDLGHIAQISRVMAKQYKYDVGPWIKYLKILNS